MPQALRSPLVSARIFGSAGTNTASADLYRAVRQRARTISLVYFGVCSIYIVLSGLFVFGASNDESVLFAAEIAKGMGFVLVTTAFLYLLLRRGLVDTAKATAKMRQVFDAISDAVFVLDAKTRTIRDCNPAVRDIFGYEPGEIIGKTTEILHVDTQHYMDFDDLGRCALEKTGRFFGEFEMRRRGGQVFASQHSVSTYHDITGALMVVSVVRDITQQKQVEEELRLSQRLKAIGQMAAGVAHDFNNHLTVILSNLSLTVESTGLDNKGRTRLETSLQAARRAAQLAASLSTSARRQSGMPESVDLCETAESSLALVERTFGSRIKVVRDICDEPIPVFLDPGQFEDAVLNLSINARDAMPDGGALTVRIARQTLSGSRNAVKASIGAGTYGVLTVTDTGAGISPEILEQVTEPFFTTKDRGKGTGLGLAMIHEFMRQSRGYIRIESRVGEGTTVELYFPLAENPA